MTEYLIIAHFSCTRVTKLLFNYYLRLDRNVVLCVVCTKIGSPPIFNTDQYKKKIKRIDVKNNYR